VPLSADVIELIKAQERQDENERSEYVLAGLGGAAVLHHAKKAPAAIARLLKIDFRGHDLFGKYAGQEITLDGEESLIQNEEDVLAILEAHARKKPAAVTGKTKKKKQ
jgi:co-chaperonin GroES (HSP10)